MTTEEFTKKMERDSAHLDNCVAYAKICAFSRLLGEVERENYSAKQIIKVIKEESLGLHVGIITVTANGAQHTFRDDALNSAAQKAVAFLNNLDGDPLDG